MGFVIAVVTSSKTPTVDTCLIDVSPCKCTYESNKSKPDRYTIFCESAQLDDVEASRTLTSFARFYSETTPPLKTVNLQNNALTRIPREFSFFSTRLQELNVSGNAIMSLHHRDVDCNMVLESLDISSNKLKTIQMGSFQGNLI